MFRFVQRTNPAWLMVLIVVGAEIIIETTSAAIGWIWGGSVSTEILAVGFVDALVAAGIVGPQLIYFFKRAGRLADEHRELRIQVAARQAAEAQLRESEARYRSLVEHTAEWVMMTDERGILVEWNRGAEEITGMSREEVVGQPVWDVQFKLVSPERANPETHARLKAALSQALETGTSPLFFRVVEVQFQRREGSLRIAEQSLFPIRTTEGNRLCGISRDITERKRAETEILRRLAELEAVNRLSTAMRSAATLEEILPAALQTTLASVGLTGGSIWLYDPAHDELRHVIHSGWRSTSDASRLIPEKPGQGIAGYVFATGKPYVARELRQDPRLPEYARTAIPAGLGGVIIPIRAGGSVIGTLSANLPPSRELTDDEIHLLTILAEVAGNAIQRTTLHDQTERRLRHLSALFDLSRALATGFDLPINLSMVIDHVSAQLEVDAADVLLAGSDRGWLEFAAGTGFRSNVKSGRFALGESLAGRAATTRKLVHLFRTRDQPNESDVAFLEAEEFVEYYGVPLLAKGVVVGVLEVFHRSPLEPDREWLDLLDALASQCALAIDNDTLFRGLERSNSELGRAYDATIEGWSRALDLRDEETEGHTQRVTELTVRLARAFGFPDDEIVHVRRGALLHDIGKMGIPDAILLKPGPLTEDEWTIMRKHPQMAYELLSPIDHLGPALDIPFCHHEKWDGTGYPRRLQGDQIPLAARLFAVIDVWDALRSDRPYRAAWPAERVSEHIRALAGTHFDPEVVEKFFALLVESRR